MRGGFGVAQEHGDIAFPATQQDAGTFQAGGATGPSLVLLVSPETAEQLARATAFGDITVTIAPLDAV